MARTKRPRHQKRALLPPERLLRLAVRVVTQFIDFTVNQTQATQATYTERQSSSQILERVVLTYWDNSAW
jgi:hypothetical protein